jgi:hypothetical protein
MENVILQLVSANVIKDGHEKIVTDDMFLMVNVMRKTIAFVIQDGGDFSVMKSCVPKTATMKNIGVYVKKMVNVLVPQDGLESAATFNTVKMSVMEMDYA